MEVGCCILNVHGREKSGLAMNRKAHTSWKIVQSNCYDSG